MTDLWELAKPLFWPLMLLSAITFLGSAVAVPVLVIRLPVDYLDSLSRKRKDVHWPHPALHILWVLTRNFVGWVLIVAGVLMLVFPGQGLLTILVGLPLVDFPGRRRVLAAILSRRHVLNSLNWIRRKAGRPPFHVPQHHPPTAAG